MNQAPNEPGQAPSTEPIHRRISQRISAQIGEGRYPAGSRLPSEAKLAIEFGVSRGTLRQALATLQRDGRTQAIPSRGHFVRAPAPIRAEARRRQVGVVVPSVAKPYVPDILVGIEDELHIRGYTMVVGSSGASGEQQAGRVQRILDDGASGLIAYPVDYEANPALFAGLSEAGFPVVLIDRYLVGHTFDAVISDNLGGAYAAVRHLLEQGHRRVAFVSTDNLSTTSVAERLQGYRQALVDAGVEPDASLQYTKLPVAAAWPAPDAASEKNARRIAAFLARTRPTAVFALHDHIAVDVLAAASEVGMRIPDDLALVGFDDDPFAKALAVPLSTVAQPRERMGRVAAGLVLDRIEGQRTEVARIVLPTALILRRSSERRGTEVLPEGQPETQAASA
jgi:GntR family transcriptional regulator of arabinose operon